MSVLLDKQTEIAAQIETIATAIEADIVALKNVITQKDAEITQLQETLANIGTPEQLQAIIQPAIDHLNTIEQAQ